MAETAIEWTRQPRPDGTLMPGYTFNPWRGCCKVSEGCKNCYAEAMSGRNPSVFGKWGPEGVRSPASASYWRNPLRWDKIAKAAGEKHLVFCASLADVFEGDDTCHDLNSREVMNKGRELLWKLIQDTPNLTWLLLTKRPENILKMIPESWRHPRSLGGTFPDNAGIGTSVENQKAADQRIPHLKRVYARFLFLSCEPLLGPVDLLQYFYCCKACGEPLGFDPEGDFTKMSTPLQIKREEFIRFGCPHCHARHGRYADTHHMEGIDWVIAGGESGPHARPMHPDWAGGLRDQCFKTMTPFFFKQWGEWLPVSKASDEENPEPPAKNEQWLNRAGGQGFHGEEVWRMRKLGKHIAGAVLEHAVWREFPYAVRGAK